MKDDKILSNNDLSEQDILVMREVLTVLLEVQSGYLERILDILKLEFNKGLQLLEFCGVIISDEIYVSLENRFREMVELPLKKPNIGLFHINPFVSEKYNDISDNSDHYEDGSKLIFAHKFVSNLIINLLPENFRLSSIPNFNKEELLNLALDKSINTIYRYIFDDLLIESIARSGVLKKLKDKKELKKLVKRSGDLFFLNLPEDLSYLKNKIINNVFNHFNSFNASYLNEYKSFKQLDESMEEVFSGVSSKGDKKEG